MEFTPERVSNSIPWRLVLPGDAFLSIFSTDVDSSFSCKAGACVSFPITDKPFRKEDEITIQIVGSQKQVEDACKIIFSEMSEHLESEDEESLLLKIMIPLKATSDVEKEFYTARDSMSVDVQIHRVEKTEENILELRGSEDDVLKAVSIANAVVSKMNLDGHFSSQDFPIGIIGEDFHCVKDMQNSKAFLDSNEQHEKDINIKTSSEFIPEIQAEELTTASAIDHAKMLINKVKPTDVITIKTAVEKAFQEHAGPMLEHMDEETKKDVRKLFLLNSYYSILDNVINNKSSWMFLPEIPIDSLADETARSHANIVMQQVQPWHVPLIETAVTNEVKSALNFINTDVYATLNQEQIKNMTWPWKTKHYFDIVKKVVNTSPTTPPRSDSAQTMLSKTGHIMDTGEKQTKEQLISHPFKTCSQLLEKRCGDNLHK